jgi:cell division protein FtsA
VSELQRCLCEAGLKVKQTVAGPLAVAEAVLTGAERELGVVCVDIGAGLTRVAYINHGQLEEMEIFPVGSGHITSDLAVGLHTTLQAAEKIKIQYGLRHIDGHVGVPALSSPGEHNIPGSVVAEIIKLRIEEILDFIKRYIDKLQLTDSLPGGIVITGGGSRLTGLPEMAGAVLGMPVRVGAGRVQAENIPEEEAYRYVSAIGLGLRGSVQEPLARRVRRKTEGGILGRLKTWL